MLTKTDAERFAAEWIAAWNSGDLARILAHYAADFIFDSPFIPVVAGEPSGVLRGKAGVARIGPKRWTAVRRCASSLSPCSGVSAASSSTTVGTTAGRRWSGSSSTRRRASSARRRTMPSNDAVTSALDRKIVDLRQSGADRRRRRYAALTARLRTHCAGTPHTRAFGVDGFRRKGADPLAKEQPHARYPFCPRLRVYVPCCAAE